MYLFFSSYFPVPNTVKTSNKTQTETKASACLLNDSNENIDQ